MADETPPSTLTGAIGEGIRTGLGILTALKEAVEETVQEAVDRGELSPERARQAVAGTTQRVQAGFAEALEKLDLVSKKDYESLRDEVEALKARIAVLEAEKPDRGGSAGGIPVDG